jgi:hypothetical protein
LFAELAFEGEYDDDDDDDEEVFYIKI